jgi:hypothetical protein
MTYRVEVLTFRSPWLNTFAEAWTILNNQFQLIPREIKDDTINRGICWIELGDGRKFRVDDIQSIASTMGLLSGEGEGFMFYSPVPVESVTNMEPLFNGLIKQWLIQRSIRQWLLEEIEKLHEVVSRKLTAKFMSPDNLQAALERLAEFRLQIAQMTDDYKRVA